MDIYSLIPSFIRPVLDRYRGLVTFNKVRASVSVALASAALTVGSAVVGVGDWKMLAALTGGAALSSFRAYWVKEFNAYGLGVVISGTKDAGKS